MNTINLKINTEPSLENDALNIKEQHDNVIRLITGITGSATIAISAPYGGGKTFFAQCLENTLKSTHNNTIDTIYIDLWSNDYKNPLATFVSSLSNSTNISKESIKSLKNAALQVLPFISSLINLAGLNTEKIKAMLNDMLTGKDKENIDSLKKELKKLAKKKKLVFLVDEIDRCKPDYAVETLETIKHFFDIENIVFVLFINPHYIANIENKYINYGIGNHGYIEKFIDKTIILNIKEYNLEIKDYNYMGFLPKFNLKTAENIVLLIKYFSLTPREVLQILKNAELFKKFYTSYNTPSAIFYTFLMYSLKIKKQEDFKKILLIKDTTELFNIIKAIISDNNNKTKSTINIPIENFHAVSYLGIFANALANKDIYSDIINNSDNDAYKSEYYDRIRTTDDNMRRKHFLRFLTDEDHTRHHYSNSLTFWLNAINDL